MTGDLPVAVVTGANRGLGRGVAEALAARGYAVVLTARDAAKAEAAAREVAAASGGEVVPFAVDITSDADADTLAVFVEGRFGRVDALVNNAGAIFDDGPVLDQPASVLLDSLNTNTLGPWRVTRALAPLLRRGSTVTNVSSEMGALSDMGPGYVGYRTSKTALNALTVILHGVLCARGVKVNAVCPGWVRTEMGGRGATRSLAEGVRGIVWAATLPADGPSGGFFRDGEPLDW